MAMTNEEIYDAAAAFISGISGWGSGIGVYIGIATDPKDRLFNDHGVSEANGDYEYWEAQSSADARAVESSLLHNFKNAKGGGGGGDESTKFVYVYGTTPDTREDA